MNRTFQIAGAGLLLALMAGTTSAQPVPGGVPAVPAAPVAAPGVGPGAAAAPKMGFFKRLCSGFDECRRKICGTPAGQLLNGATKPASMLTGGVIPSFCPVMPSEKDLQKPGVSGTAAAAQKDALEAKQRREAVRFLGTLDCRYYPDAVDALTAALRTDGSECVRYEAALVLGRGCCCTEKTVKALDATVSGTEIDGNPAERSVRVRCAAAIALERCLSCYTPPLREVVIPPGPEILPGGEITPKSGDPKSKPVTPGTSGTSGTPNELPAASRLPKRETVEHARKTLNEFNAMLAFTPPPSMTRTPGIVAGRQSLYHLLRDTANDPVETYSTPGVIQTSASVSAPTSVFAPATPALVPTPAPVTPSTPSPVMSAPTSVFSSMAPVMTPAPAMHPSLTSVFAPMSVPMMSHAPTMLSASMKHAPTSIFAPASAPAPAMARTPAATPASTSVFAPNSAPASITNRTPTMMPSPTSVFAPPSSSMPHTPMMPAASTMPSPTSVFALSPMMPRMVTHGPAAVLRAPTPQISVFGPEPAQAAAPKPAVPAAIPAAVLNPPMPAQSPVSNDVVPAAMAVDPAVELSKQVVSAKTAAERIAAMRELKKFDWQKHLVVASVLVHAGKNDRDTEVRIEAIRFVAARKVMHPQVLSMIALLTTDLDDSIRDEATKAMEQLK
jgi:hypothetical protein